MKYFETVMKIPWHNSIRHIIDYYRVPAGPRFPRLYQFLRKKIEDPKYTRLYQFLKHSMKRKCQVG